jgi:peptide/nickel transport system substrate-binding protein
MKKYLSITLVLALILTTLAACSSGSPTSSAATSSSPASAVSSQSGSTPAQKQVVVGINADYITFDPAQAYEKTANMIFRAIYDTLVTFDPSNPSTPVGDLAKDWTISTDGKTYTFNLNQGIMFSTGATVTSKDVKWCFERVQTVKGNPSFLAENIVKIDTPDDYTVVITLKDVDPSFLTRLSQTCFSVADSAYIQKNCSDEAAMEKYLLNNSVGSGSYIIKTFELNNELILERNPNYARTAPAIDRFVFKHISDPGTQLMNLQKGDLDFAFDLEDAQIQTLNSESNIQIISNPTVDIFFYMMNVDPTIGGPLANEKVREAINYSLDYEGIRQLTGAGAVTPYSIIPNGLLGAKNDLAGSQKQDLNKAKELLKEAGFEKGFEIKCSYIPDMAPDGVSFGTMAEKLQSDLAQVGITVTLVPEQVSVFLENYRNGKDQMNVNMWGPDYPDSLSQIAFLPGETVGLRANWKADMAPDLAALASQIKTTTDDAARAALIGKAQDMMQNGPFTVFVQPARTLACSKRVTNVQYTPAFQLELLSLDVSK